MRLRRAEDDHAVVVTLFVNPTQFAPGEDLSRYPRDEERDLALAAEAGVDLVFAPGVGRDLPGGLRHADHGGGAERRAGGRRPARRTSPAWPRWSPSCCWPCAPTARSSARRTPSRSAVVRRLMRDLHLDDIELVVGPIVREPDGLAMSSRNAYLDPDDRRAATALSRGLAAGAALVAEGERDAARIEAAARAVIEAEPRCALEYAAVVDPGTFAPPRRPGGARPARRRRPRGPGPPDRQRAPAPHHADEHDPPRHGHRRRPELRGRAHLPGEPMIEPLRPPPSCAPARAAAASRC